MPRISFAVLIFPALLAAQPFAALKSRLDAEFAKSGPASMSVAVARDGRFLWEQSWGWADKEKKIRATPQTMYSLASISKPITATVLMTLVEQGKVDLDRPVTDYLGGAQLRGFAGDPKQATLRRIANHTSGLPLHYHFFYADEDRRAPPFAESIRRYGILVTPPGEHLQYSNFGFGLLDHVISQVSKQPFEEYARRQVFEPLGLAGVTVATKAPEKNHAVRYRVDGRPITFYDFDHRGASALYASAHDLVRFAFLHVGTLGKDQKRILREDTLRAMTEPSPVSQYGVAWRVEDRDGVRVLSHTGGMDGVSTILMLVPSRRTAVAVLCSSQSDMPGRVARSVLSEVLPDMKAAWEQRNPQPPPAKPIPPSLAGQWRGKVFTHAGELPFQLVFDGNGGMTAKLGDEPAVAVTNSSFTDGRIHGAFPGNIKTDDVRQPHRLRFELTERSGKLSGPITALSFPKGRGGDALSSFVSLERAP